PPAPGTCPCTSGSSAPAPSATAATSPSSTSRTARPPSTGSPSPPSPRADLRSPPAHPLARGPLRTTISGIGLGSMGVPRAKNLVAAGHQVTGYNRSRGKVDAFVEAGGSGADSVRDAVREAEVVLTMLPDSPDVEAVVGGEDGVFANAPKGALWIDASTIRPDVAVALAARAREAGLRPLDAPVSGGEAGAVSGALSIMVGGEEADVDAAREVFEGVGKTIVHVGPSGSGQTVKAANQLIVAANIQALSEAVVFLEA